MVTVMLSKGSNIPPHTGVIPVAKGLYFRGEADDRSSHNYTVNKGLMRGVNIFRVTLTL